MRPGRILPVGTLALLALVGALPHAVAGTVRGEDAIPVDPDCAREPGGDETMRPEFDGSLAFPGEGCTATSLVGNATGILSLLYKAQGRPGCGLWELSGGFVGVSELWCATEGAVVEADVAAVRGTGSRFNVTWHPTSWRYGNAYLCFLTTAGGDGPPVLPCGTEPVDAVCLGGLEVDAGAGSATLEWPDVAGAARYNASATRLEPRPVRLWDADAAVAASGHTFAQQAGTYAYMVTAWDAEGDYRGAFCQVTAAVADAREVPFFSGAWGLGLGAMAVASVGYVMLRRRIR